MALRPYNPVIQTYIRDNRKELTLTGPDPINHPPSPNRGVRYAVFQGPSMVAGVGSIKEAVEFNYQSLRTACRIAQQYNAQLISFPELFLSGYEFGTTDGGTNPIPAQIAHDTARYIGDNHYLDERTGWIAKAAIEANMAIICPLPYLGKDPVGNEGVYDAAALFDRDGRRLGIHFKLHLWGIDERNWFRVPYFPEKMEEKNNYQNPSNPFCTYLINGFPVGVGICYDAEFPELARALSLNGALLNAMPTAAPDGRLGDRLQPYPDIAKHYVPANALVNQNFCSYGNRSQWEYQGNGETQVLKYTGNSIICNPYGQAMVQAIANEDTLLIADCVICDYPSSQPADADYLINRRPELYGAITAKTVPFPYGGQYRYPDEQPQREQPKQPMQTAVSCPETKG